MPVHDWTRVDAGTFHAFHHLWTGYLMTALNAGLLPRGDDAVAEQVASRMQTDLLTRNAPSPPALPEAKVGLAVAEAPPSAAGVFPPRTLLWSPQPPGAEGRRRPTRGVAGRSPSSGC